MKIHLKLWLPMLVACSSLMASTAKLQERLGEKNLAIIQNAKYITLMALGSDASKWKELHLNSHERERVKRNLLDDHNYNFEEPLQGLCQPELSLRFEDDNEEILYLFIGPKGNQAMLVGNGLSKVLNYDPAHARIENYLLRLVAAAKEQSQEGAMTGAELKKF